MKDQLNVTVDHTTIRGWIEDRGGLPAAVKKGDDMYDVGVLKVHYPGERAGDIEYITWDEFFEKFEFKNLAFAYRDSTRGDEDSRYCEFVPRKTREAGAIAEREFTMHEIEWAP
ncbi:MAG: hypothetical protein GC154_18085 [bacterium]|nr:hypothetical protein [bacterium]